MREFISQAAFFSLVVFGIALLFFLFWEKIKAFFKARFNKLTQRLKYYGFLFRWFLIGKYHCSFNGKCTRKFFASLHRAFWLFVFFNCTMGVAVCIYIVAGLFNE